MTGKVFRSIRTVVLAIGCIAIVAGPAAAQAPAKPASLSGTWNMSLIGDHVIPVALVLEQSGSALTGTFIMMGKDFPVTGSVNGTTFTLTGKGPSFGTGPANHAPAGTPTTATVVGPQRPGASAPSADMTINGTADPDGALAGEMLTKMGERTGKIKWSAERLKERKVPTEAAASTAGVSVTGKWTLSITEAQLQLAVDLTHTDHAVTGTATSDHLGTMKLTGTLTDGVLKFSTVGSDTGQEIRIEYTGKYKADGTFAGDLTSQMGPMTWSLAKARK